MTQSVIRAKNNNSMHHRFYSEKSFQISKTANTESNNVNVFIFISQLNSYSVSKSITFISDTVVTDDVVVVTDDVVVVADNVVDACDTVWCTGLAAFEFAGSDS